MERERVGWGVQNGSCVSAISCALSAHGLECLFTCFKYIPATGFIYAKSLRHMAHGH